MKWRVVLLCFGILLLCVLLPLAVMVMAAYADGEHIDTVILRAMCSMLAGGQGHVLETIGESARDNNLDIVMWFRQVYVESGFSAEAVAINSSGAFVSYGLAQLNERFFGHVEDYEENVYVGAAHLRRLLNYYDGDYDKAIAAYAWGHVAVNKLIDSYGEDWLAHGPRSMRAYVERIRGK